MTILDLSKVISSGYSNIYIDLKPDFLNLYFKYGQSYGHAKDQKIP